MKELSFGRTKVVLLEEPLKISKEQKRVQNEIQNQNSSKMWYRPHFWFVESLKEAQKRKG